MNTLREEIEEMQLIESEIETSADLAAVKLEEIYGATEEHMSNPPRMPDADFPTPPPGTTPPASVPFEKFDEQWKRSVWAVLKDLRKNQENMTAAINTLTLNTKDGVNELKLTQTANAIRDEFRKELKDALEERDAKIEEQHDFIIESKASARTFALIVSAVAALLGLLAGLGLHFWK